MKAGGGTHRTCRFSALIVVVLAEAPSKLARRVAIGVVVIGLSGRDAGEEGVGKSCLCTRLVNPGVDQYDAVGEAHSSVYTHREFQQNIINGDHFLFYGTGERRLPGVTVDLQVVEHTEILDGGKDGKVASPKPFSPPGLRRYSDRALATKLSSAGKKVYSNHARTSRGITQQPHASFPGEFRPTHYILVMDPTASSNSQQRQRALIALLCSSLGSNTRKAVIAVSKCDRLSADKIATMERENEHLSKMLQVPVMCVSASKNININELVLLLSTRGRGRTFRGGPPYADTELAMKRQTDDAKVALTSLLRQRVTVFEVEWKSVQAELNQEQPFYVTCYLAGVQTARTLFQERLLEIKLDAVKAIVKEEARQSNNSEYGALAASLLMEKARDIEQSLSSHPEFANAKEDIISPYMKVSRDQLTETLGLDPSTINTVEEGGYVQFVRNGSDPKNRPGRKTSTATTSLHSEPIPPRRSPYEMRRPHAPPQMPGNTGGGNTRNIETSPPSHSLTSMNLDSPRPELRGGPSYEQHHRTLSSSSSSGASTVDRAPSPNTYRASENTRQSPEMTALYGGSGGNTAAGASTASTATYGSAASPATYGSAASPATYGSTASPATYGSAASPATYGSAASTATYGSTASSATYGSATSPAAPDSHSRTHSLSSTSQPSQPPSTMYGSSSTPGKMPRSAPKNSWGSATLPANMHGPGSKPARFTGSLPRPRSPSAASDNKKRPMPYENRTLPRSLASGPNQESTRPMPSPRPSVEDEVRQQQEKDAEDHYIEFTGEGKAREPDGYDDDSKIYEDVSDEEGVMNKDVEAETEDGNCVYIVPNSARRGEATRSGHDSDIYDDLDFAEEQLAIDPYSEFSKTLAECDEEDDGSDPYARCKIRGPSLRKQTLSAGYSTVITQPVPSSQYGTTNRSNSEADDVHHDSDEFEGDYSVPGELSSPYDTPLPFDQTESQYGQPVPGYSTTRQDGEVATLARRLPLSSTGSAERNSSGYDNRELVLAEARARHHALASEQQAAAAGVLPVNYSADQAAITNVAEDVGGEEEETPYDDVEFDAESLYMNVTEWIESGGGALHTERGNPPVLPNAVPRYPKPAPRGSTMPGRKTTSGGLKSPPPLPGEGDAMSPSTQSPPLPGEGNASISMSPPNRSGEYGEECPPPLPDNTAAGVPPPLPPDGQHGEEESWPRTQSQRRPKGPPPLPGDERLPHERVMSSPPPLPEQDSDGSSMPLPPPPPPLLPEQEDFPPPPPPPDDGDTVHQQQWLSNAAVPPPLPCDTNAPPPLPDDCNAPPLLPAASSGPPPLPGEDYHGPPPLPGEDNKAPLLPPDPDNNQSTLQVSASDGSQSKARPIAPSARLQQPLLATAPRRRPRAATSPPPLPPSEDGRPATVAAAAAAAGRRTAGPPVRLRHTTPEISAVPPPLPGENGTDRVHPRSASVSEAPQSMGHSTSSLPASKRLPIRSTPRGGGSAGGPPPLPGEEQPQIPALPRGRDSQPPKARPGTLPRSRAS
ncbi:uncharacterized protein LOC135804869 [Sycon ciliatum]|uniref:uncharacterized protein LOC135804869 n=1 Tax=Sycon ciliatum TaxID=27933 RepID=UPI0031F6F61E